MRNGGQPSGLLKINIILSFVDVLLIGCVGTVIEKAGDFLTKSPENGFFIGRAEKGFEVPPGSG